MLTGSRVLGGKKRKFCEHCQIPTFKKHKELYFDLFLKRWSHKEELVQVLDAKDLAKDVYD